MTPAPARAHRCANAKPSCSCGCAAASHEAASHSFTDAEARDLDRYWRAANYLSAAQIYLRGNFFLDSPLRHEDIKPRLLGHWGTSPGINFVCTHLNRLLRRERDASILLVTGPGHGAAANLANLFLEGSLEEFYPELKRTRAGAEELIRRFSVPGGFPSHLYPGTPGCIHEGGELGYALATAFGAVLDNPRLIAACIVGDGEAETGATATAWHSAKFLNPACDGAVLPILHLNGYKISSATIYSSMSHMELQDLFVGYGFTPIFVSARGETLEDRRESHRLIAEAMDHAHTMIRRIQRHARNGAPENRPSWPLIILRSPKGWTCPAEVDGKRVEGSYRSHQVPMAQAKSSPGHLALLEAWLRSYRPGELFGPTGPADEVLEACPTGEQRMGMNPHALGGSVRRELHLPDFRRYAVATVRAGGENQGDMSGLGRYLRDVITENQGASNFRIFCPDEMTSNRLDAVFEVTSRQFCYPSNEHDEFMARSGRVMEMLSEHTCQGWLQGYLLTGRHGLFPCYEAFAPIVDSMMNQFAKFLKVSAETPWRRPVSSLNYLLTSEGWRQDHNGYSHQGPGFINNLLTRKAQQARIYLPPDTNCLLSTIDHCLTSTDKINLVVASKQPMPQWLTIEEAMEHCRVGASVWKWASTDAGEFPDVVLAAAGVYTTLEAMAAAALLREEMPELRVRVVNVTDLLILETHTAHPHGLSAEAFTELFTASQPVIFNFHGYPGAIKQLLFSRPGTDRFHISGYVEEGTTTTPFDLMVRNGASRWHILLRALEAASFPTAELDAKAREMIRRYHEKFDEHSAYIQSHGEDLPEIRHWRWS